MRSPFADWRLWAMIASLIVSIGWLDIVRGRQLTILEANQHWVMRELTELQRLLREHERAVHVPR